jgi:hypothetical protein
MGWLLIKRHLQHGGEWHFRLHVDVREHMPSNREVVLHELVCGSAEHLAVELDGRAHFDSVKDQQHFTSRRLPR